MEKAIVDTLPFEQIQLRVKHLPLKRIFDLTFCFLITPLLIPLLLIITGLVKSSSRGRVIYYHERIGRGGKVFRCYKFRTMYYNAEQRLEEILSSDKKAREEWESTQKLKDDPRVTPVGHLLRKFSLDELPQFWNVLRGDLSVVGPRPVVQEEIDKHFGSKAKKILSIRPGLTGIWQVSGRSDTSYSVRVELDEKYVDQQTFFLDLYLIVKTIPAMLLSRGAY